MTVVSFRRFFRSLTPRVGWGVCVCGRVGGWVCGGERVSWYTHTLIALYYRLQLLCRFCVAGRYGTAWCGGGRFESESFDSEWASLRSTRSSVSESEWAIEWASRRTSEIIAGVQMDGYGESPRDVLLSFKQKQRRWRVTRNAGSESQTWGTKRGNQFRRQHLANWSCLWTSSVACKRMAWPALAGTADRRKIDPPLIGGSPPCSWNVSSGLVLALSLTLPCWFLPRFVLFFFGGCSGGGVGRLVEEVWTQSARVIHRTSPVYPPATTTVVCPWSACKLPSFILEPQWCQRVPATQKDAQLYGLTRNPSLWKNLCTPPSATIQKQQVTCRACLCALLPSVVFNIASPLCWSLFSSFVLFHNCSRWWRWLSTAVQGWWRRRRPRWEYANILLRYFVSHTKTLCRLRPSVLRMQIPCATYFFGPGAAGFGLVCDVEPSQWTVDVASFPATNTGLRTLRDWPVFLVLLIASTQLEWRLSLY